MKASLLMFNLLFFSALTAQDITFIETKKRSEYNKIQEEIEKIRVLTDDLGGDNKEVKQSTLDSYNTYIKLLKEQIELLAKSVDDNQAKVDALRQSKIEKLKKAEKNAKDELEKYKKSNVHDKINLMSQKIDKAASDFREGLNKIKTIDEQQKKISQASKELKDLKVKMKIYSKIPTEEDVVKAVNETSRNQRLTIGAGLFVSFFDDALDAKYYINKEGYLAIDEDAEISDITLSFGAIFSYKLPILQDRLYVQTNIPILNMVDPTGSPTTVLKRTSGAIGFGIDFRKDKDDKVKPDILFSILLNFGTKYRLKSGKKALYLTDDNKSLFPGKVGDDVSPLDDEYDDFFEGDTNYSLSLGVSLLF